MGEAKNRRNRMTAAERIALDLEHAAVNNGKLIDLGWESFKAIMLQPDTPEAQVREMRKVYFAGAQHLWASWMGTLDEGVEPTEADMRRLDSISRELEAFAAEMNAEIELRAAKPEGNA